MNPQFAQPKGSTSKETNKDSIARKFGCKKSEVIYAKSGQSLSGYKVIYDKVSQRAYALPSNIGAVTVTSLVDGVLTHSGGTVDLGELAVSRREFDTVQGDFTSGVILKVKNEVIAYSHSRYRWNGTFPKVVDPDSAPNSTDWINVDANPALSELAKSVGASLIGYKPTGTTTTTGTVKGKLDGFIDFANDYCGGPITGQPDLTSQLQQAIIDAFNSGVGDIKIVGDFYISDMILWYPGVRLLGGRYDTTLIRASNTFPVGGTMLRSYRPPLWNAGCHGLALENIYFVGRSAKDLHAVDINDASYFNLEGVRYDLFNKALSFNRWIDETRVDTGGTITYPNAYSVEMGGQSYFGTVTRCYAGSCVTCVDFNGVVNRCTFTSNTWTSSDLAYNFSNPRGVYETNTFITCNIEGVKVVWEWFFSINSPYHNVWINTSIDNGNPDITCLAKDGGRQTFVGLAIFPYGNPSLVNWYNINPNGHRSTVLGTDLGESLPEDQLKTQVREELHTLTGIANKQWAGQQVTETIPAGGYKAINISIPGLKGNSAVIASLSAIYAGVSVSAASNNTGIVAVIINNHSASPVEINAYLSVTGIAKSFL
ncbi:tail spike protein [Salmonella phage pertopsoe]|uniref:Tailspike protein n=1 Tax=Salmonella phage pertopsoe TaxID=2713310 RepID=A0A6G8RP98_9CAUD|nr:tail spike protein [Salmonella phage pertopsoe]QIO03213.1 tailspike protein [Salmonella phage pertopsoe]